MILAIIVALGVILKLIDIFRLIYYSFFTTMGFEKAKEMIDSEWG